MAKKYTFSFLFLFVFASVLWAQTPEIKIRDFLVEREHIKDTISLSRVENGYLFFMNMKTKSDGVQPAKANFSVLIWKEFIFDSHGGFVESHFRITERDCKIVGKEICDILEIVDSAYKAKFGNIIGGTIDLVEKPDYEWIQVPTNDGNAFFDMRGNFVEEIRFDR